METKTEGIDIRNRKARFDYQILERFIAGIVLTGSEIKSVRNGKVSLSDSYCFFRNGELFIKNLQISEYEKASYNNHDPLRERKLLLKKVELRRLQKELANQISTIVPLRIFTSKSGYAKIEIASAKGKKDHDKREDLKKKDIERETQRRF